MAIIKTRFVRHMKGLVKYVLKDIDANDPVDSHDCHESTASDDFEAIAKVHHGKGEVNALHVIQSWGADESKKLLPAEFNAMGRQLVEQKFPGHAFLVVTHTETDKIHNHIVVSPWHTETGKKIENKKRHLYELRDLSDELCRARGLSVIDQAGKDRQARLPQKVQAMAKFNGRSWYLDLVQKADFARSYATSYNQYVGILEEFGIGARVEEKNISYSYGKHTRAKRGSKIGTAYDKPSLEETFRTNSAKFAQVPGLREKVFGIVGAVASGQASVEVSKNALMLLPNTTYEKGHQEYSRFTKTARPGRGSRFPHEIDASGSIIPIDEIRRARNTSILGYCRANKIEITPNSEGKFHLKGREFVELGEFEWVNKRNKTHGSLIEFVAAHKNMTFLQAIAEVNGNKRLLILEQHLGETKRTYTSFHIPKEKQLRDLDAKVQIAKLVTSFGADAHHAQTLFKSGQAQVDQSGRVRLFGKDDEGGCFEFVEAEDKTWSKKSIGKMQKPFFSLASGRKKAVVYTDPFSFLKANGKHALWPTKHSTDVLCLMEPNAAVVDHFLAQNKHVRELHFMQGEGNKPGSVELDFFNNLKSKCGHFGIELRWDDGKGLARERSVDLPSL
jgi:hypothetical protein